MAIELDMPPQIKDLAEVSMLLVKLFEGDIDKAKEWMEKDNEVLFDSTAYEVCLRGDGDKLIKWLKDRLGEG